MPKLQIATIKMKSVAKSKWIYYNAVALGSVSKWS